jgi:hypothetical protein
MRDGVRTGRAHVSSFCILRPPAARQGQRRICFTETIRIAQGLRMQEPGNTLSVLPGCNETLTRVARATTSASFCSRFSGLC